MTRGIGRPVDPLETATIGCGITFPRTTIDVVDGLIAGGG